MLKRLILKPRVRTLFVLCLGFVNLLLSLPIMLPLSRLTYGAYLFQQIVIFWYYHNLKVPLLLNHITAVRTAMLYRHLFLFFTAPINVTVTNSHTDVVYYFILICSLLLVCSQLDLCSA